ncbi:phage tail tape measure protein [Enterobacter cancerogenus]|uniref:phage tail tape measure protein n=1 Tax=Enterobacter cancerogenus TaxID=69218 RepID=UPI00384A60CB
MADVASLAVGLHLNAANFKSQLMGAYGDAENSSKRFNRNAQEDAKKTDEAYSRMGKTIAGVAGLLAGFAGAGLSLGAIITTTREYGQALSDLSAITGATGAQLKTLDEAAQEMGRSTEYSASQAVEALKLMASAKPELLQTADGLTAATKSALTLAQAAGSTLPDATRTLALSLNQFGAGAQEADRYINVLAAGAKFGASEIADTAAAIKNGGVAAAQAGVGFETLNAAIQVLAEREIKGGEAGTALRNVILSLEKGTDKTLKPSVVGLSGALENLSKKNLSTAQAVKLFGVENINAASVLVDNRSKLDALTQALTGTQTAHEQAAIRVNNLNGDIMGLTSAFEGMIIKIGQSSTGPLRSGIQSVTDGINLLTDNFNAVASVALYTLIPVLSTKLTAGLRENVSAWQQNQAAVKAAAAAQADGARKTLEATAATLKRNDAEFGYYRQMEKTARQQGLNVNYQGEFNRLIREETEQTNLATRAKMQLAAANRQVSVSARAASVAVGLARGALAFVGGAFGAATLAGSALLYFHQQAKEARQSAVNLKDAVVETTAALMQLSDKQLAVKQLDLGDQLESQLEVQENLQNQLKYMNKQIDQSNKQGWIGDVFGNKKDMQAARQRAEADLESVNQGIQKTRTNLEIVGKSRFLVQTGLAGQVNDLANDIKTITAETAKAGEGVTTPWTGEDTQKAKKETVNQYLQLRREIEEAHATSLGKIDLQEKASQEKLIAAARKNGASEQDLQRTLLMNAENYQKQRAELAEQYSPARSAINQEKEASQELKSLFDARLLTEKEYMAARVTLSKDTSRQILQAQANALSAPRLDLAGEVDPLAQQRNQLLQQQSLIETYYRNGAVSKQQYEMLMQKSSKDSADAQYQTALELYRSQSDFNNLAIGLVDATRERTTNVLTGLLTNTQTFKEGMINLFSTLTQSIIQNLVDMAAQALLTNTILSSIMSVGSSVFGAVGGGAAASSGTAIADYGSNFQLNAKGGVYSSSDLSAYSGQVVDNPTFFAFAKGAGVMGEAGPEAIMPLTRAADGSLGVRAVNSGAAGGDTAPKVYITIDSNGNTTTQAPAGLEQFGNDVGRYVDQRYKQNVMRDIRPGGDIWNAMKGTR